MSYLKSNILVVLKIPLKRILNMTKIFNLIK